MKVSFNWLQDYFEQKLPNPNELGELLTFHAYEIEGVSIVGDDHMIDVDVLPNRSSDSLSHIGIAREISAILNIPLKNDPFEKDVPKMEVSKNCSTEVKEGESCPRMTVTSIKGVNVGPSPEWLRKRLETIGQRSINNIVDATNYVMFNLGQPLHAFDADKLKGDIKKILVRSAKKGEKIITLTNDEYELDPSVLLIVDGNSDKGIGLAGVKGGKTAEVDNSTKNIIIESAHFEPTRVRKTAQKLKLWTDASTRFQNNPSSRLIDFAVRDVTELILEIAEGELEGHVDENSDKLEDQIVVLSANQINGLLGISLKNNEISAILDRLQFPYEVDNSGKYKVTSPFFRKDINIPEDIIEEVGRIHGYEHLKAEPLPKVSLNPIVQKEFYWSDKIRNILIEEGYSEIYGYTFRSGGDYEAIIAFAQDKTHLRTNLGDGMKEYLGMNQKNAPLFGLDRVKLFEIGGVFPKEGEHKSLALGVSGKKVDKLLDEIKKLLESKLNTKISDKPDGGILEINFSKLIDTLPVGEEYDSFEQNLTEYQPFSLYPFVLRDLALWVPSGTEESKILNIVTEHGGDLLNRATKFDEFEKEGKVSFAFHLVFQALDRTLTDDEVGEIMDKITADLNKIEGFEVR